MMTWIARLCMLCAMSSLMQMALPGASTKNGVRKICGLLMLRLTADRIGEIGALIGKQTDFAGILSCLMS